MAANGLTPPRDPEKFMAWVVEMLGSLNRRLPGGSFTQPPAYVPTLASTDAVGLVELATVGEAGTGTDETKAVTPAGARAVAVSAAAAAMSSRAPAVHQHTMADITDAATAIPEAVPVATTEALGKVELATTTEAQAGTDGVRAVTPAGLKAFYDARPVPAATTEVAGVSELATQAEAVAGVDTSRTVTPSSLRSVLNAERLADRTAIRRGSTVERDAFWGAPAAAADQVALAKLRPTWFNTERGWLEQYFVPATTTGWVVASDGPALASGIPAGWYPIAGRMPRATLFGAGSQTLSGGTGVANNYTNWRAWGGNTGAFLGSRRSHSDLFSLALPNASSANAALAVSMPGIYSVALNMALPAGMETPVGSLRFLSRGTAQLVSQPVMLFGTYAQHLQLRQDTVPMSAADYAHFQLAVGMALAIGSADSTWLTLEYKSPQFNNA